MYTSISTLTWCKISLLCCVQMYTLYVNSGKGYSVLCDNSVLVKSSRVGIIPTSRDNKTLLKFVEPLPVYGFSVNRKQQGTRLRIIMALHS